jgi:hypothetical protein
MRHLKAAMILAGSLTLTALLALAGCGDDHGDHFRGDRDRYPERVERHDSDRHVDSDRHDEHPALEGEHRDR